MKYIILFQVTKDVICEFAADNVKYLELRSTPRAVEATGMSKRTYIDAVLRAISECQADTHLDIVVRLLLSVDRRHTQDVARETMGLALEYKEKSQGVVVGLDLCGDPSVSKTPSSSTPHPHNPYAAGGYFGQYNMITKNLNNKRTERHLGTHLRVLGESYPINTNMTEFRWFPKIFTSLCFGQMKPQHWKG